MKELRNALCCILLLTAGLATLGSHGNEESSIRFHRQKRSVVFFPSGSSEEFADGNEFEQEAYDLNSEPSYDSIDLDMNDDSEEFFPHLGDGIRRTDGVFPFVDAYEDYNIMERSYGGGGMRSDNAEFRGGGRRKYHKSFLGAAISALNPLTYMRGSFKGLRNVFMQNIMPLKRRFSNSRKEFKFKKPSPVDPTTQQSQVTSPTQISSQSLGKDKHDQSPTNPSPNPAKDVKPTSLVATSKSTSSVSSVSPDKGLDLKIPPELANYAALEVNLKPNGDINIVPITTRPVAQKHKMTHDPIDLSDDSHIENFNEFIKGGGSNRGGSSSSSSSGSSSANRGTNTGESFSNNFGSNIGSSFNGHTNNINDHHGLNRHQKKEISKNSMTPNIVKLVTDKPMVVDSIQDIISFKNSFKNDRSFSSFPPLNDIITKDPVPVDFTNLFNNPSVDSESKLRLASSEQVHSPDHIYLLPFRVNEHTNRNPAQTINSPNFVNAEVPVQPMKTQLSKNDLDASEIYYIDITIPEKQNTRPIVNHQRFVSTKNTFGRRSKRSTLEKRKREKDKKREGEVSHLIEYDGWQPLDVVNPMSNEPTFIYKPPPLKRVHFGEDPPKEKPLYPVVPVNPPVYVIRAEPTTKELHSIYGTENIDYLHVDPKTDSAKAFSAFGPNRKRNEIERHTPPESERNSTFSLSDIFKTFISREDDTNETFDSEASSISSTKIPTTAIKTTTLPTLITTTTTLSSSKPSSTITTTKTLTSTTAKATVISQDIITTTQAPTSFVTEATSPSTLSDSSFKTTEKVKSETSDKTTTEIPDDPFSFIFSKQTSNEHVEDSENEIRITDPEDPDEVAEIEDSHLETSPVESPTESRGDVPPTQDDPVETLSLADFVSRGYSYDPLDSIYPSDNAESSETGNVIPGLENSEYLYEAEYPNDNTDYHLNPNEFSNIVDSTDDDDDDDEYEDNYDSGQENSDYNEESLSVEPDYYYMYEFGEIDDNTKSAKDKDLNSEGSDPFASIIPVQPNAHSYKDSKSDESDSNFDSTTDNYDEYYPEASENVETKIVQRAPLYELLKNFDGVQYDPYIFSASENDEQSYIKEAPPSDFRFRQTFPRTYQPATGRHIGSSSKTAGTRNWYLIETRPKTKLNPRWKSDNFKNDRKLGFRERKPSKYYDSQFIYKPYFTNNFNSFKPSESLTANSLSELLQIFKYVTTPSPKQKQSETNAIQTKYKTFRYTKPTEPPRKSKLFTTFRYTVPSSKLPTSTEPTPEDIHDLDIAPKSLNDTVAQTNSLDGYLFSDSEAAPEYTRPEVHPNIIRVAFIEKPARGKNEGNNGKMDKDAVQRGEIAPPFVIDVSGKDEHSSDFAYLIQEGHSRVKIFGTKTQEENKETTTEKQTTTTKDHIVLVPASSFEHSVKVKPLPTTPIPTTQSNEPLSSENPSVKSDPTEIKNGSHNMTRGVKYYDIKEFRERIGLDKQIVVNKNISKWLPEEGVNINIFYTDLANERPHLKFPNPPPPIDRHSTNRSHNSFLTSPLGAITNLFMNYFPVKSKDALPVVHGSSLKRDALSVPRPVFYTKRIHSEPSGKENRAEDRSGMKTVISHPFEYLSHLRMLEKTKTK